MRHGADAASTALRCIFPIVLIAGAPAVAGAAEPQADAVAAYDEYAERARQAFLARVRGGGDVRTLAALQRGRGLTVRPAGEDGIIGVSGGLVHHWVGAVLVRGATLEQALDVSRAYADYPAMYESVVASTLLGRDGDTFRVRLRIREGAAGVSATLDIWSSVRYFYPDASHAYALSTSAEIREVEDAGRPSERHLPAGRDHGYLWRASTLTSLVERDDGVYAVMETLGLSRRFPPLLGWLIEPIARRLGRKSVEATLEEFRAAVRARVSADAAGGTPSAVHAAADRRGQRGNRSGSAPCSTASR
ncbi:MAG: hypothetical protein HY657_13775 [Acidobacteria bacterium]|nr:hypothetical protein [Acidobacteriota bacterium]